MPWVRVPSLYLLLLPFTLCLLSSPPGLAKEASPPLVHAVAAVGMTVGDMDRSIEFYSKVLSFQKVSDVEVTGSSYVI